MELLHAEPAAIWRMLIPRRLWLFPDDLGDNELIFAYRDQVFFVGHDGSVLAMAKPQTLARMRLADLLDRLAASDETVDFDDNGMFDYGAILKWMGYVVPVGRRRDTDRYLIEIVNTIAPDAMVTRYELKRVSFTYALYHALMRCFELNEKCDGEFEHEVKRIAKVEPYSPQQVSVRQ